MAYWLIDLSAGSITYGKNFIQTGKDCSYYSLVAVIIGGYDIFIEMRHRKIGGSFSGMDENFIEDIDEFVKKMNNIILSNNFSKLDLYLLDFKDKKWKDPFFLKEEKKHDNVKSLLIYSGFLSMGNRLIAVINDMEYEKGDQIIGTEYIIKEIRPNFVAVTDHHKVKKIKMVGSD